MVKKAQWLTRGVPLISYPCTWFIVPNDEASLSGEKNLHLMKCPQKELNPLQNFCSGFFMDLNHLGVEVDFFSLQNRFLKKGRWFYHLRVFPA